MTTALAFTFSILAAMIPGFVISPQDPGTILGFAVVGACMFFTVRDYVRRPRRLPRSLSRP
jgi:hypothetical protein